MILCVPFLPMNPTTTSRSVRFPSFRILRIEDSPLQYSGSLSTSDTISQIWSSEASTSRASSIDVTTRYHPSKHDLDTSSRALASTRGTKTHCWFLSQTRRPLGFLDSLYEGAHPLEEKQFVGPGQGLLGPH